MRSLEAQYIIKGNLISDSIEEYLEKRPRLGKHFARPSESSDILYQGHYQHPQPDEPCEAACDHSAVVPRSERHPQEEKVTVHLGLVASGNAAMNDASFRDRLAFERDVLCFENSAAGVMGIFPSLVICGICDYSDSHKHGWWLGYAGMAAAVYVRDLLHQIPPTPLGE